jgi:GTP-binding protein
VNRFTEARFLLSAAAPAQFPADSGAEVAFAGRSNAGKSSAINAILGRRALARTGKTPGQTRLINFFELGPEQRVVDLPGYGYAQVSEQERRGWVPLIDALRVRASLRGLFLIVDARRGLGADDQRLIDWADPSLRSVHVLLSKADKLSRAEATKTLKSAQTAAGTRASVQLFSALHGTGLDEARRVFLSWLGGGPSGEPRDSRGFEKGAETKRPR